MNLDQGPHVSFTGLVHQAPDGGAQTLEVRTQCRSRHPAVPAVRDALTSTARARYEARGESSGRA
jgi:hypothetical protein